MGVRRYRKKPVVIEAWRFTDIDEADEIAAWCGGSHETTVKASDSDDVAHVIVIPTLEGNMTGQVGDYVIRGVKGEFYPVKPDIFEATYEPVEE